MPFVLWPSLLARALIGLLAFARTPVFYLIVVSLFNLLVNLGGPAYSSIMRTNYSDAYRGRLMGNIRIIVMSVSTVLSACAGILLNANETLVRWLFLAAAVFGILSALIFARIRVRGEPAVPMKAPSSFVGAFRIVARNSPFLVFMGILFLCATPDKLAVPLEPIWLVDFLHLGYGEASLLLGSTVSAASIAGYYLWAKALKRFSSFTVLTAVVFLFALRFATLGLARTSSQLLPMSILSGIVNAGWDLVPIFCIIALSDRANFSMYIGFNTTCFGIRGLIGPSIGTFLYASGVLPLGGIFLMIGALLAVSGSSLWVFSRRQGARLEARAGSR
jgi:MFS family permease